VTRRHVLWIGLALVVLAVVVGTAALLALPRLARPVAVWQLESITGRPVSIDAVDISLASGRFSVRGFRIADPDGGRLADFERLEGRFHRRSLFQGHLWIEEATLTGAHVRLVRNADGRFNISDLLERPPSSRQAAAVTIDHFALAGGSVVVEDRVLSPARTWRSDDIRLDARALSTRKPSGTAVGSAVLAGSQVTARAEGVQLAPLHLQAWINVRDVDLPLVGLYLPADAVQLERGVLHAGLTVAIDPTSGTRVDADAVVERLALRRRGQAGDALTAPSLDILVRDLVQRPGSITLRYASVGGDLTVLDPTTATPRRLTFSDFTFTASGLEQSTQSQAQIALHANVPGGGEVDIGGAVGLTPRRADLRVRARGLELATLSRYLPIAARLDGTARADVRVTASGDKALSLAVAGDATVERVSVGDGTRTLASAARVSAGALQFTWPATVRVGNLVVSQPAVTVERDAAGAIGLAALLAPSAEGAAGGTAPAKPAGAGPALDLTVARLQVDNGRALVTDAASGTQLDARRVTVSVADLTWPGRGPARVQASASVGAMELNVNGTVEAASRAADVAVRVRRADLALLQPWLPIAARVGGLADADVRVVASQGEPLKLAATGDATLRRLTLQDGARPAIRVSRIAVVGAEYSWPASVRVARLTLSGPSATLERDAQGMLDVATLFRPRVEAAAAAAPSESAAAPPAALDVAVGQLEIQNGRATIADAASGGRAEVTRLAVTARDVTWPARNDAHVQVSAAVAGGEVTARGTIDAARRRGELAVTLRGADLAALEPWLPIVGRVRGAADADVTVVAALEPFALSVRGAAGAYNLGFYDAKEHLLTIRRVEATGLDVEWPTKLAIDRLNVDAPWAKVERTPAGELSLRALFRRRPDLPEPAAEPAGAASTAIPGPVPGMQVSVREALFDNGGLNIVDDAVEPAARFELKGSRLALRNLTWPARGVAAVELSTPMPGREGSLRARGTFSIEPTRLALDVDLDQVDLSPGRPYLPIDARLSGRLTGKLKVNGSFGDTISLVIDGDAAADRLALGDDNRRLATVRRVELTGLRYRYPTALRIRKLTLDKPWMLVERDSQGRFELMTLLAARAAPPAPAGSSGATPAAKAAAPRPEREPRVRVAIDALAMEDGFIRFVDRSTEPDYAEEISAITLAANELGTRANRQGKVVMRGTFASGTPLTVSGEVGGFNGPRYLDVTVNIQDFPLPRLNPYLNRQTGWIASQGTLTAAVRYRLAGDDLEATNDITLVGFEVERPATATGSGGPPLDTIVSLLKNREGVIKLNVPVHGSLSSPEFEYGDAVWAAMRNLAIRLVALPFSLVGKLFFTEDSHIKTVSIDPVTFQTARAAPTPAGTQQLEHMARFLGAAPAVKLRLRPVTTVADVGALRREALDTRLASLGTDATARRRAAEGLYTELFPRRQPPASDEVLLEELTRETPTPPRALRDLAAARVAAVSEALVRAGIPADRLERLESRAAVESEGAARVEFEIAP
jgi:uncharacterized protein involved in outer membrane biogenesis